MLETTVVAPTPGVITLSGKRVIDQVPDAGKPLKLTLASATEQLGCVIVPTIGVAGKAGCAFITTLAEAKETQFEELVTV